MVSCVFCEVGICVDPTHQPRPTYLSKPHRPGLKTLPSAKDYRQARQEKMEARRQESRQDIIWRRRTEQYQVDNEGVFEGSYSRGNGKQVLVRGSTIAQVRWEKEQGERYWQKVPYQAPT
ncbi:hypothetical protein ACN28E_30920 [Archangium lansingense]|uniref:hypothetical protein n=1 Tax=Archangium lansingense TaxID=2995310 RepID=UPI003B82C342